MKAAPARRLASLVALATTALVGALLLAVAPTSGAAEQRDPVIFVHGWSGGAYN